MVRGLELAPAAPPAARMLFRRVSRLLLLELGELVELRGDLQVLACKG